MLFLVLVDWVLDFKFFLLWFLVENILLVLLWSDIGIFKSYCFKFNKIYRVYGENRVRGIILKNFMSDIFFKKIGI